MNIGHVMSISADIIQICRLKRTWISESLSSIRASLYFDSLYLRICHCNLHINPVTLRLCVKIVLRLQFLSVLILLFNISDNLNQWKEFQISLMITENTWNWYLTLTDYDFHAQMLLFRCFINLMHSLQDTTACI